MEDRGFDLELPEPSVVRSELETTAGKGVAALTTMLGTLAAEGVAALADAYGWVHGIVLALGGAANVAAVYWTKNHPKN